MSRNNAIKKSDIELMKEACWCCDNSICTIKTGCVVIKNGKVILRAWNTLDPIQQPGKSERESVTHAEKNLLDKALEQKISLRECTLYTTRFPCPTCAELLNNAGITKIFYMSDLFTDGNTAQPFFEQNNVETFQIKEGEVWDGTYQT